MRLEKAASYGPALLTAPLGAVDPTYAAIAFGMVTGWLALAGVMFDADAPPRKIGKAMIVSVLIGGGGALFAAFAVERLHLSPLGAAVVAFGIAFGGVKTIKILAGGTARMIGWLFDNLADDAAKMGRKRQEAHKMMLENSKRDRARLTRALAPDDDKKE